MEAKQNLNKNSSFYFKIGLAASILLSIVAFEWKSYDALSIVKLEDNSKEIFEPFIEIPIIQEPAPTPKSVNVYTPTSEIVEVTKETKFVVSDSVFVDNSLVKDTTTDLPPFITNVEPENLEIVTIADQLADFNGGISQFYKYIRTNLKYDARAAKLGIGGKVYVEFVVEKDGSISNVSIIKGVHQALDAEAVRVVNASPEWLPAKNSGRPVRFKMVLPIEFVVK